MSHTPGSWRVSAHHIYTNAPGPYHDGIAHVMDIPTKDGPLEQEANGRLIAAAPELLEALESLRHWAEIASHKMLDSDNWPADLVLMRAEEAIRVAKGDSP